MTTSTSSIASFRGLPGGTPEQLALGLVRPLHSLPCSDKSMSLLFFSKPSSSSSRRSAARLSVRLNDRLVMVTNFDDVVTIVDAIATLQHFKAFLGKCEQFMPRVDVVLVLWDAANHEAPHPGVINVAGLCSAKRPLAVQHNAHSGNEHRRRLQRHASCLRLRG